MREKELEKLKDYKYGFSTDIENIKAPKGLNEDVIKFISNIKKEPEWMLEFRLKAFERLKVIEEPNWQKPKYPKINYQDLYYYSAPKSFKEKPKGMGGRISAGFFVLSPGIMNYIEDDNTIWEQEPLNRLASENQLMAYEHDGFFQPMDTLRDKRLLQSLWDSGSAPWKLWS